MTLLIGAPTRPLHTLRELADWLTVNGGPMADWGRAVHHAVDQGDELETLAEMLDSEVDRAQIENADGATLNDCVMAVFERYHHVRNDLSEHFDIDIADPAYAPTVTKFSETAVADSAFASSVRALIVRQGATNGTEDNATTLAMLGILLGV